MTIETAIGGEVDLTHAARAKALEDAVMRESGSRIERHRIETRSVTRILQAQTIIQNDFEDGSAQALALQVSFSGTAIFRFEQGRMQEAWNSFDFPSLYRQLGLIPRMGG